MTWNQKTAARAEEAAADAPVWQPMAPDAETEPVDEAAEFPAAELPATELPAAELPAAAAGPSDREVAVERVAHRAPSRVPARRSGSTTLLLMLSALVALGGIGFAVGRATSSGSTANNQANNGAGFGAANGSFNPGQFRPDASGAPDFRGGEGVAGGTVTGTVVSVTSDSMTIKLASGETVTVALGSGTTYHSQASASSSDVTTGSTVVVQTTTGSAPATAGASPSTGTTNRTATDVTVTSN